MGNHDSWYNQDAFWELFEPILFNQQRRLLAIDQVDHIVELLQIREGAEVLDLCCGTGRHSLELSAQGFSVTGVDRTERFIEVARLEAKKRELKPLFIIGDMRDFCSPNTYDVILNLFGSFGYFEDSADDLKVVKNMFESLRPGGYFLIEMMGKEILARDFQAREWEEIGDTLILSEKKIAQNWARVETRWIILQGTERVEHQVSLRSFSALELSSLLEAGGFSEVQVYGSLAGIKYDQNAQRLVVVGRK